LIREFLRPALDRRMALAARVKTGELQESDLPMDLLGLLALHGEAGQGGEDAQIWRECALFLVAGTQTTSRALPHIVWHLDPWWAAHPEDRARAADIEFLSGASNESLRLHQPVPALLRKVTRDTVLACNGRAFQRGERIALFFSTANRDAALYGADVETFNPLRPFSKKPPPWGLTFGSGAHTCIGRALVTGLSHRYDDAEPTHGTIVGVLQALYQAVSRSTRRGRPNATPPATTTPLPACPSYCGTSDLLETFAMSKLIIEARINKYMMREQGNVNVPYTPDESAANAVACRAAGAAIVHFHARKPDGTPEHCAEVYVRTIRQIRGSSDILVHPTLGYNTLDDHTVRRRA